MESPQLPPHRTRPWEEKTNQRGPQSCSPTCCGSWVSFILPLTQVILEWWELGYSNYRECEERGKDRGRGGSHCQTGSCPGQSFLLGKETWAMPLLPGATRQGLSSTFEHSAPYALAPWHAWYQFLMGPIISFRLCPLTPGFYCSEAHAGLLYSHPLRPAWLMARWSHMSCFGHLGWHNIFIHSHPHHRFNGFKSAACSHSFIHSFIHLFLSVFWAPAVERHWIAEV